MSHSMGWEFGLGAADSVHITSNHINRDSTPIVQEFPQSLGLLPIRWTALKNILGNVLDGGFEGEVSSSKSNGKYEPALF